jgi:hypothetical protein
VVRRRGPLRLLAARPFGGTKHGGEAANLAVSRDGLEARLRAGFEVGDMATQRRSARPPTIDVYRLTDEELEVLESALRKSIFGSPP